MTADWFLRPTETIVDLEHRLAAADRLAESLPGIRARAEKAEADARVARNELALERESYEQMHDLAIQYRRDSDKWAALAADATTRAEKAEAERYDLYSELALAKARLGEIVELCGDGGDGTAFGCVESLVADLAEQTARAEKYLAAAGRLTDAMRTTGIVWKQEIWQAFQALEKLVEEARRG